MKPQLYYFWCTYDPKHLQDHTISSTISDCFCNYMIVFAPRVQGGLPIDTALLGFKANECRAYAKALHHKEDQFHKSPSSDVLQNLISINNKLGQEEAATGEWVGATGWCH